MISEGRARELDGTQRSTLFLSMHLRNELENFHSRHGEYLHDGLMPEFNSTIRYAVYDYLVANEEDPWDEVWTQGLERQLCEALCAFEQRYLPDSLIRELHATLAGAIRTYLDDVGMDTSSLAFLWGMIPDYWEIPELDPRPNVAAPESH